MQDWPSPVHPGQPAPRFALPGVNSLGVVSIDDFLGRHALLLGLYRGLHCPFCRRKIAQLAASQPVLAQAGVESVAVVNTPVERARLYFQYRPTPVTLLSDPECSTHHAYGVPSVSFLAPDSSEPPQWPHRANMKEFMDARINPTGELSKPESPFASNEILNRMDGFEMTPVDERIRQSYGTQLAAHILIDRHGIVQWTRFEGLDGPESIGKLPTQDDLIAAAKELRS